MDEFELRYVAVLLITTLFGILAFWVLPSLGAFYSNQFIYGSSIPQQLNGSILQSLEQSPFSNSILQSEVTNGTLFNISLLNTTIATLKHSSNATEVLADLFRVSSKNISSNDPDIQPNFDAVEQMLLGSYVNGGATLLYADLQYQLIEEIAINAGSSLGLLNVVPNNVGYVTNVTPSLLMTEPKYLNQFLIRPYQPGNSYLLKLSVNGKEMLYVAEVLVKLFSCRLFGKYNIPKFHSGYAILINDFSPTLAGSMVATNESAGPDQYLGLQTLVPSWLEFMADLGSSFLSNSNLNSNLTCIHSNSSYQNISSVQMNSTYKLPKTDMLHLLSLSQEYGYLATSLLFSTNEHPNILNLFYLNGTLVIDLENVNLGQTRIVIMVDGKPVNAQAAYSFIYANIMLPLGTNNVSLRAENATLSSNMYVNPPVTVQSYHTLHNGFSLHIANFANKTLNITGINAYAQIQRGGSVLNYTINRFYIFRQNGTTNSSGYIFPRYSLVRVINSGKVNNFTTPSGGNFTMRGNYSFGQPTTSLRIGDSVLIRLFLNTSNYPNTVAEYYINLKVT